MKKKHISHMLGAAVVSTALTMSVAHAKGGNGNGNGKSNGAPSHSQKQKGPKGPENKASKAKASKPDKAKGYEKQVKASKQSVDRAQYLKDRTEERKEYAKDKARYDAEFEEFRDRRFVDDEREEVISYFQEYRDEEMGLPRGLAKQYRDGRPLPPGWQKKVEPGYVLDDEWDEYFYPVEYDLFPTIDPIPNSNLYWVGDRVVQVYEPRREIIDTIRIPTITLD